MVLLLLPSSYLKAQDARQGSRPGYDVKPDPLVWARLDVLEREEPGAGSAQLPRRRISGDLWDNAGADSLTRQHGSRRGQRRCGAARGEQPAQVKADGRLLLLRCLIQCRLPPHLLTSPSSPPHQLFFRLLPSCSSPPPRLLVAWRSEPPLGSGRDARLRFWISSPLYHHPSCCL